MGQGLPIHRGIRNNVYSDKTIGNTLTETTIFGTSQSRQALLAVPANGWGAGMRIRIRARGYISTLGAAPGTLTTKFKRTSTALATGTSATLPTSLSNALLEIDAEAIIKTTGGSGTIDIAGFTTIHNSATGTVFSTALVTSTAATFDTTAAFTLDLTLTWSVNDVANTLTITMSEIEVVDVK